MLAQRPIGYRELLSPGVWSFSCQQSRPLDLPVKPSSQTADKSPLSAQDAYDLQQAELQLKQHPVGRYQIVRETPYPDGSIDWTCLDTATGEIEMASLNVKDPQKSDFDCAH